jgi:hypothetical protein
MIPLLSKWGKNRSNFIAINLLELLHMLNKS